MANVISLPTASFAVEVAKLVERELLAAQAARGYCRLGLAGGETPRAIHAALAASNGGVVWEHVWITFGDERCVPPDDAASNYGMAKASLLDQVPIDPAHVLRMRGEIPQAEAAAEYERLLADEAARTRDPRYVHDLLMLGMGEDGHTASLFPGLEAAEETSRNVVPAIGPKPPPERLTMTLPLINAACRVFFIVGGVGKASVLKKVLAGDRAYPSARVQPTKSEVTWLVTDELAAALS